MLAEDDAAVERVKVSKISKKRIVVVTWMVTLSAGHETVSEQKEIDRPEAAS